MDMRWELTRRHPYYLSLWRTAARFYEPDKATSESIKLFSVGAVLLLARIGVSGPPLDPALPADEVAPAEGAMTFLAGSIMPAPLRMMANLLAAELEPETLDALGKLFIRRAELRTRHGGGWAETADGVENLSEFLLLRDYALDSCQRADVVSINLEASDKLLKRDLVTYAKTRRTMRPVRATKIRPAQFRQILDAWDAREGWTGSAYDIPRESHFKNMAFGSRVSVTTLFARYRRAFELVSGHEYSLENWVRLFYVQKLFAGTPRTVTTAGRTKPIIRGRRRTSGPAPKVVLVGNFEIGRAHELTKQAQNESGYAQLWIDLVDRLRAGKSNEQIRQELDLTQITNEQLDTLRDRMVEVTGLDNGSTPSSRGRSGRLKP